MLSKLVMVVLLAANVGSLSASPPIDQSFFGNGPVGFQQLILTIGSTTTILNATDTGWYDSTGFHSATNKNYFVGFTGASCINGCKTGFGPLFNNYFVFDLSTVVGNITGARLSLGNGNWYVSPNSNETLAFWDVAVPVKTLMADNLGRTDILDDLGSGVLFGSRSLSASDVNVQVVTSLNDSALVALNAAKGTSFALGGSLASAPTSPDSAAFSNNSTGLSTPASVITLSEIDLPINTEMLSSYVSLGVIFSPGVRYAPSGAQGTPYPNFNGIFAGNFGADNPIAPAFSIHFVTPQTRAAFALATQGGAITIFEALLNGVVQGRAFRITTYTSDQNYFGFEGILFDEIHVTEIPGVPGENGSAALDNIQFGLTSPTCTYSVSPSGQAFRGQGGFGAFTVNAGSQCSWSAVPGAGWITILPSGSKGTGTVNYAVATNTGVGRSAAISVGGQHFNIDQAASSCSYFLNPAVVSFVADGGDSRVVVDTPPGCPWTAASNAGWLSVTSSASGTGNGAVTVHAVANAGGARSATVTIAGQTFSVAQAAQGATACGALDVTSQVAITDAGHSRWIPPTNYSGSITVRNGSGSVIRGPVYLVLVGEPTHRGFPNDSFLLGTQPQPTTCFTPQGDYLLPISGDLQPGQTAGYLTGWTTQTFGSISYSVKVLSGTPNK